jgi:hypothetical protein
MKFEPFVSYRKIGSLGIDSALSDKSPSGFNPNINNRSIKRALYESIERDSFIKIRQESELCINELGLKYSEQNNLQHCLSQLSTLDIDSHKFSCCSVIEIVNGGSYKLPSVFYTYNHHKDREYVPFVDSNSMAIHDSIDNAISGSLKEFFERQFLMYAFASKKHKCTIDYESSTTNKSTQSIYAFFSSLGTVKIYDLSFIDNIHALFATFSFHDGKGFVSSMSLDIKLDLAVEKVIEELLQTFIFVNEPSNNLENARDYYAREALRVNIDNDSVNLDFLEGFYDEIYTTRDDFSLNDLLVNYCREYNYKLYLHVKQKLVFGNVYYASKVFSPDFFVHKSTMKKNNYLNPFSPLSENDILNFSQNEIPFG